MDRISASTLMLSTTSTILAWKVCIFNCQDQSSRINWVTYKANNALQWSGLVPMTASIGWKNHFRVINSVFCDHLNTVGYILLYASVLWIFVSGARSSFKNGLTVSWRLRFGHHTLTYFTSLKRKSSFFVWIVYQLKDRCEMEFELWVGFRKKCASWPKHKDAADLQYNVLSVIRDFVSIWHLRRQKKLANNTQNVTTYDEISRNVASQTSTLRLKAGSPSSPPPP